MGAGDAPRVLCAGHINWDVTLQVACLPEPDGEQVIDHLQQAGGGSAANVAVALAGFDAEGTLFGSVGGDDFGALALRELDRAGVDPGHVMVANERQTSVKYLIVDDPGEVMVLANEGANEAFAAADLDPSVLARADHLHITGQSPRSAGDLAHLARGNDTPVSFDPGRRIGNRDYSRAIDAADVLFLNELEAEQLGASSRIDPEEPESLTLVVKLGGGGAEVRLPGGQRHFSPAFDVEPVDTTGAGDAFAAGFLAACFESTRERGVRGETPEVDGGVPDSGTHHLRNADLEFALTVGNAAGALAAKRRGARTSLSWEAVDAFLEGRR